ncbi:hypothetical protein LTR17_013654 [Elasticomyces elasticus]|nr:hypothetical protein LTR17_013654 [Elasticomyces elasticus]
MATINIGSLYGNATFSDVTIKFGDTELKAHKFVLSSKSTYFAKILEGNASSIIKLDGDSEAIDCMLRYIYQEVYPSITEQARTWRFHLRMASVGDTYGLSPLKHEGVVRFERTPAVSTSMAIDMLRELAKYPPVQAACHLSEQSLRETYILKALQTPQLRDRMLGQPGTASECVGILAAALTEAGIYMSYPSYNGEKVAFDKMVRKVCDKIPLGQ